MKISKACAIFENIDSPDFTDLEKGKAIYEVLKCLLTTVSQKAKC